MVLIRQIAVGSLSTLLFTGVAHAVNLEQAKNIIAVQVAQEVHDPELAQDIVNIRFQREILSKLPQQAATDPHAPQAYIASQPTQLAEAQTHDMASHEASTHGHEGMQAMHEEEHEEAEEDAK